MIAASGGNRNSNGAPGRLAPPTSVSFLSPPPSANNHYEAAAATTTTASTTDAFLRATILTAYDLPLRDPPSNIRLTVGNHTITTGPPIQRHKDRNSFRFHSTFAQQSSSNGGGGSNLVIRCSKLEELYEETAIFTVEYPHKDGRTAAARASTTLTARYKLSQLKIHEVTWLILSLDDFDDDDDEDDSSDDSSTDNNEPVDKDHQPDTSAARTGGVTAEPEHTPSATARKSPSSKRGGAGGGNRSVSSRSSNRRINDTFSLGWEGEAEDDGLPPPPSLRLQLTLEGPYRPEVSAIISLFHGWLSIANRFQGMFDRVTLKYFSWWDTKLLLVPAVPLFAVGVVATPLIVGLCVTFLPMLLPLAVLFSVLIMGIAILVAILYASTRKGREHVGGMLQPLLRGILATSTGQRLVYETGPRPTPVALCRTFILPQDMWGKLLVSLTLDGLGSASFLVPILGEVVDVVFYAHVQTLLVMAMYDNIAPNLKYISFLEEFLPFTDLMPSATVGWLKEYGWIPLVHMILQNDKIAATASSIQRKKRRAQDRLRILAQQGAQALTTATTTRSNKTNNNTTPMTTMTPLTTNTSSAKRT